MGTTISLILPEGVATAGLAATQELFATWEATLSRFRPESELSLLNRRAGNPVPVGALLFDTLATALDAARATDGLYDPTLLHHLTGLGYDRSFEELPESVPTVAFPVAPGGGWREVTLDRARRRVTLPPGVGVDLGGIAKGMAVDAALARLRDLDVTSALVNAGGDLAVMGSPTGVEAWPIAIPGAGRSWTIPLVSGAMATSGVARRRWRQGTEERHHLLDPRTGKPARSGLWSVTVVAARCIQAEVAAKAAFVLGPREGAAFLAARGLAGLLVDEDGDWQAAGAWPVEAFA